MAFKSSHSNANVTEDSVSRIMDIVAGNIPIFDVNGKLIDSGIVASFDAQQLALFAQKLSNGTAVIIEARGDSTTRGFISGGVANPTSGAQLQATLRDYFDNAAATVNVFGVDGNQTTNALRTWDAVISASLADVIYINYGINDQQGANPAGVSDPAISAYQYAVNLIEMIRIVRKYNKIPVLQTPTLVIDAGAFGSTNKSEGVKQFAEVARIVSKKLNVTLVDIYNFVCLYTERYTDVINIIPDGIHPAQQLYSAIGRMLAEPFLCPGSEASINSTNNLKPATSSIFRHSGGLNAVYTTIGSLAGVGRVANKIKAVIKVTEPGLDLYWATAINADMGNSCQILLDGVSVWAGSTQDTTITGNNTVVDHAILISSDVPPGIHNISMYAESGKNASLYYLQATKTRAPRRETNSVSTNVLPASTGYSNVDGTANTPPGTNFNLNPCLFSGDLQNVKLFGKTAGTLNILILRLVAGTNYTVVYKSSAIAFVTGAITLAAGVDFAATTIQQGDYVGFYLSTGSLAYTANRGSLAYVNVNPNAGDVITAPAFGNTFNFSFDITYLAPNVATYIKNEAALMTMTGLSGQRHYVSNIPFSIALTQVNRISFTAQLNKDSGVVLFSRRSFLGTLPIGGILIRLNAATGFLEVLLGGNAGYGAASIIGASDLSTSMHLYKMLINKQGLISFYVDGVFVGEYSTAYVYRGGYIGLWTNGTATAEILNLGITQF